VKTASVTELKAHLSKYIRVARRGGEVQIVERGVPVARLVGMQGAPLGDDEARIDRLARAGILRRGTGDLRWILRDPPQKWQGSDLARALDEDREDRV
jgi:prevent-host-death family protein